MSTSLGWHGKQVRHLDGRIGTIEREVLGFCHVGLHIVATNGDTAVVQLNTDGPDSGDVGWMWCWRDAKGGEPAQWDSLGDHNPPACTSKSS